MAKSQSLALAYLGGCELSLLFFLSAGPDPVVCGGVV
jgi:hypothetical protein